MSSVMTMTLPSKNTIMSTTSTKTTTTVEEQSCPNCGISLPASSFSDSHAALLQAQREIEDLQAQVRLLNQKATAAVDRWADYEDELTRLRAASTSTTNTTYSNAHTSANTRPHTPAQSVISTSSPRSSFLGAAAASRISQLLSLSPRKPASSTPPPPPPRTNTNTTTPRQQQERGSLASSVSSPPILSRNIKSNSSTDDETTRELISALTAERQLRLAAEERLLATGREVEDLSASLFEQANTMVATERRARAELEDRVRVLRERCGRVDKLEEAVRRIERARGLIEEGDNHHAKHDNGSVVVGKAAEEREMGGESESESEIGVVKNEEEEEDNAGVNGKTEEKERLSFEEDKYTGREIGPHEISEKEQDDDESDEQEDIRRKEDGDYDKREEEEEEEVMVMMMAEPKI